MIEIEKDRNDTDEIRCFHRYQERLDFFFSPLIFLMETENFSSLIKHSPSSSVRTNFKIHLINFR